MEKIFFPIHILTLLFVLWNIFKADHMGLDWMRGKATTLNSTLVHKYHMRVWIGLIVMILSGIGLFWNRADYLLSTPGFYVKMWFVGVLVINAVAIGRLNKVAAERAFASLTKSEKNKLLASGVISTVAWLGAIACALFLL